MSIVVEEGHKCRATDIKTYLCYCSHLESNYVTQTFGTQATKSNLLASLIMPYQRKYKINKKRNIKTKKRKGGNRKQVNEREKEILHSCSY